MAITAAPFALKNLGLDAEPLRQAVASLVPNQGGIAQVGDLAVTQTTTPSLGVQVGVGRAWMPGTNTTNVSGQTYSTQGQYFAINDAPLTVNLSTADPTNPRIDLIYIGVIDTAYGGASNVIKIDKVTGTPAGTPTVPALPANSIALAQVNVAANATSILNASITNTALAGTWGPSSPAAAAQGLKAEVDMTAAGSAIGTTVAVVMNIPSFTFKANRWYCLEFNGAAQPNNGGACMALAQIFSCSTADAANATTNMTELKGYNINFNGGGTINNNFYGVRRLIKYSVDTTLQIKGCLTSATTGVTWTPVAGATWPTQLSITDMGAQF